jgi:ribonucleotide monophosphatase NagD (HAD superfamily)
MLSVSPGCILMQVLAIGDSLEHDIAGAAAFGIDSIFIAGGIHAAELGVHKLQQGNSTQGGSAVQGADMDETKLDVLCTQHKAMPRFVDTYLKW